MVKGPGRGPLRAGGRNSRLLCWGKWGNDGGQVPEAEGLSVSQHPPVAVPEGVLGQST